MLPSADACYRAITRRDRRYDGRFFTAVVTTGIYCRPVCPSRTPLRRNVLFFPSAQTAAQAGFRACKRCRPDAAPESAAWRGTQAAVQRALRLIDAGALDRGGVAALAAQVGLGERQLRRLFRRHLGETPVAVAQRRRALRARRLLEDTALPVTEVALRAGFGSIRRFNSALRAAFGAPPRALRRAGAPASPAR
jgi:AraC family transcriptional regulator of adaptative response / DNA-3-methyladenine glycosylase II